MKTLLLVVFKIIEVLICIVLMCLIAFIMYEYIPRIAEYIAEMSMWMYIIIFCIGITFIYLSGIIDDWINWNKKLINKILKK